MSTKIYTPGEIAGEHQANHFGESVRFIITDPQILADVEEAAAIATEAADGDSNDEEIEALQDALDAALAALGLSR